ncbi:MAG: hypothetical protein EBS06_04805 [Proteobacteria bacterium]|nr:hypothetical protein [Pseudomonadota bacterium]
MISSKNYINDNAALKEVIELIRQEKLVALDTEFMRDKTYYPILSLIQIAVKKSGEQKLFIIDVLSGVDLEPFLEIIFDKKIIKILHSSLQDLQIFCQKNNVVDQNILKNLSQSVFDTQIMANFCGFDFNAGYSNLVEILLQKNIDKTLQRSDWQKRPLSLQQLEYAILDVIFLEEIYEKLLNILVKKNRQKWYEEEVEIFITKAISQSQENLFKNFSLKGKSESQVIRIKNLILWREEWAKKLDLPRQHFIKDNVLERIVYSHNLDLNLDQEKINQIKEIMSCDIEKLNKKFAKDELNFASDKQKNLYKKAKELIAKIACEENLKEQLLITSQNLKNLIYSKKQVQEVLVGWRYQVCGEHLKKLISEV